MSDDTSEKASARHRISLNEDYEGRNRCKSLMCTPELSRAAVKAAGDSAESVREHLAKK